MNKNSGDDVTVTYPLFQEEFGGSTPTSPLQLYFFKMGIHRAVRLNELWHSRLPIITNWQSCISYAAECNNKLYAVALWGPPIARGFNNRGYIELRRMAINNDAPKYTATRMLGWMLKELKKSKKYVKAISYQDTSVHKGTIYKASGWKQRGKNKGGENAWQLSGRKRNKSPASGDKIRWEYDL